MAKIEFDPGNTQFPEGAKDMTVDITDFIGVFEKAYSKEWCESTMKYFDRMDQLGFGRSIQDIIGTPRHLKDTNNFNNWGVNLSNVVFIYTETYSHWTRDHGPQFLIGMQHQEELYLH